MPKNSLLPIDDSFFQFSDYDSFLSSTKDGRGVAVFIKKKFSATLLTINSHFQEAVFCKLRLRGSDSALVGCVYRSPNSTRENFDLLTELLYKIRDLRYTHKLIMGDFNIREINWNENTTNVNEDHIATVFSECVRDSFLIQHVKQYTRIRENQEPSLLDLILTNEENMVNNIAYNTGLGKSDHLSLVFDFNCYIEVMKDVDSLQKYNFFKGDYEAVITTLQNKDWENELHGLDLSQSWSCFAEFIIKLIEKYIPVSKARGKGDKKNLYVNRSSLNAIRNKQRKWTKYKHCMTQENYDVYKSARNNVITELRRAKYMYEKDLTAKIKDENKLFWSYVRSKTKTKSTVSQITNSEGELSKSDQETADILNNFFTSVFEAEGDGPIPEFEQRHYENELSDIMITEEIIDKLINQLKSSKSQGPDNIHPKFLKETHLAIKQPLKIIFQQSLKEGKLPDMWKVANVTPIYKKGNKRCAENYRPISLTSVTGKILEKIIRNAIVEHMTSNDLFSEAQHGFVAGRSCVTQLLEFLEEITESIDNGEDVDVIYLDFCKAFDKVPHKRLLKKLCSYGIVGKVFNWIKDFLSNRKQRVMINGSGSEWQKITSGIPQGSVLGPILFLIFINDLPDVINVCIKLFADDGKIYSSVNTEGKKRNLQENITKAENWANTWKMFFNKEKCHHLHIGKRNTVSTYTMNGDSGPVNIEKVNQEKDLGVIVDKNLKFRDHIMSKVNIANRNVGIIFRTFTYLDSEMFLNLYKALVRPHLEYASQIWTPLYKKDKITIENVQRRATRLVRSISHLSYENRLRELGLPTLEYRRERADMVQVYKIFNGIDKIEPDKLFTLASHRTTRGHSFKLFKPRARLNTRRQSFSNRIVDTWNSLPDTVVRAPSLNSFKSRLNLHWKHHQLKFTAACYLTDYETRYRQVHQDAPLEAEIA